MPPTPFRDVVPRLRRLLSPSAAGSDSDGALVARFAANGDECAFAELVRRHGPLVRGVCRRVLGHDRADDAFQATFLVLARKAGSIRRPAAVGSWLYGVAYHLSQQARTRAQRREKHERLSSVAGVSDPGLGSLTPATEDPAHAAALADLLAVLDEELARLPDRLRAPLLACYIDGRTHDEAARQLGWSLGTFRRRLDAARDVLRARMERRGATLSAGLFATLLAADAVTAAVPAELADATKKTVSTYLAGGTVAPSVAALARGGLSMIGLPKLATVAAIVVLFGGLTVGAGALRVTDEPKPEVRNPRPEPRVDVPLPAGAVARLRHGAGVYTILVTPDGRTILTQGMRSVRYWDAKTGADRGGIDLPEDGPGFWTSSLTPDGKTLLTTRHDGTGQVWDVGSRILTRSFRLAAPPFDVSGAKAAHAPDGSAIAVVTSDGSIRVCDVGTGQERPELRSHSDAIVAAVFSPDSKSLLLASDTKFVFVWDAKTGRESARYSFVPNVRNLAVSADSAQIAGSFVPKQSTGAGETGPSPARGEPSQEVVVFNVAGRALSHLGGHPSAGRVLAFTPDGRFLLAPDRTAWGRSLLQWDLATGRAVRQYLPQPGPITALTFSPDGQTMLTADTTVHRWNWKDGREIDPSPPAASMDGVGFVVIGNNLVASPADASGTIVVRELATGREDRRLTVPDAKDGKIVTLTALATADDGRTLAAAGVVAPSVNDAATALPVWVWDLTDGGLRHRFTATQVVSSLAFSTDGVTLAGNPGGSVVFWDLKTGQEKVVSQPGQVNTAVIGFPPPGGELDGNLLGIDGQSGRVIAWSSTTGESKPLSPPRPNRFGRGGDRGGFGNDAPFAGWGGGRGFEVGQPHASGFMAHTPDFRRIAFVGRDSSRSTTGDIRVVEIPGHQVVKQIRGLRPSPRRLALSTDGKRLAAASEGETPAVTVWDVETGKELRRFTGLRGQATGLAFTPDGKRLVAASSDGTMLVWDVGE